jgi:hypothetical protein
MVLQTSPGGHGGGCVTGPVRNEMQQHKEPWLAPSQEPYTGCSWNDLCTSMARDLGPRATMGWLGQEIDRNVDLHSRVVPACCTRGLIVTLHHHHHRHLTA